MSKKKGEKPIQQIPIKENDEIRTITVHLDTKKIMNDIEKARKRREQLSENPPASLPEGSIETIEVKEAEVYGGKAMRYLVTGKVGDDTIEACINANPKASIINFSVNGSADSYIYAHHYKDRPIFNLKTDKIRIIYEENRFMENAIKKWLRVEHKKVHEVIKQQKSSNPNT